MLLASGMRSAPGLGVRERERAFRNPAPPSREDLTMTSKIQRGFSLLEMIITIAIGLSLAGITFVALMPLYNRNHVELAYETTLMALRNTRQLAISQSHQYYVTFNAASIQITYQPPAVGGILPAPQQVSTLTLPSDISYSVMSGFPTNAPDSFGSGITPIDFGQGLGAGSLAYVCFMPWYVTPSPGIAGGANVSG